MTDPIITAAKADRDRRDAIKARLFDGLDPAAARDAALDLLLVYEEDVDSLRAGVRRLTDERDQARCAARDNAHQHERLLRTSGDAISLASGEADRLAALLAAAEADAETQRRAACSLRDALDRVATAAGVSDGSGGEVADRVIAAIADLRERSAKPECQPAVAIFERRMCEASRMILRPGVAYRFNIDPGCRKCREDARPYRSLCKHSRTDCVNDLLVCLDCGSRCMTTWGDRDDPPEPQPAATVEPAPTPPAKPAPRYAPSPIDHLLGQFAGRYVVVAASAAMGVPPDRVAWHLFENNANNTAANLNEGCRHRAFYAWGSDPLELHRWAVVDRGEPIGEEG